MIVRPSTALVLYTLVSHGRRYCP